MFCTVNDLMVSPCLFTISTSCVVVSEPLEVSSRYMPALFDSTAVTPASCFSRSGHSGGFVGEMHFHHIVPGNAVLERHGRIERDQLSVVDDRDAVAQAIGFVHVVGGNQHGEIAGVLEVVEHLPHGNAGDRIEPGGGLVEKEDARIVNQAARDLKAAPHSAGERLGLRIAPLEQVHRLRADR